MQESLSRRLIFTVCTGRCGTKLLAERLAHVAGVTAVHEPAPRFQDCMRDAQHDPTAAKRFWQDLKLPAVQRASHRIYIETSNLFCKGFLQPLLSLGLVPDLILLSRPHREVAASLHRIECIPARNESGRLALIGPDDPGVLPLPGWRDLTDYQLCYWYCLEIERRQEEAAALVEPLGGCVARTSLAEIRTSRGMAALLEALDLPKPGLWRRLLWDVTSLHRVNRKRRYQRAIDEPNSLDAQEREVRDRIASARSLARRAA